MEDGSSRVLKGPWSSNSHAVNTAGFDPCMEVSWTEDYSVWERGHTFYGGAVLVTVARDAIRRYLEGVYLIKDDGYWCPSLSQDEVVKEVIKEI